MTVSQLYNSVAQLGFEDSLESDKRFIFAANRALLQVNSLRPATGSYLINHQPLKNKAVPSTYTPIEKTEDIYFYAENVKSYYFEVNGVGVVYFQCVGNSGDWETFYEFEFKGNASRGFKAYKDFIKKDGEEVSGRIRLKFSGEYVYSVRSVAMYEHLYSDEISDIPSYGSYSRYDMSDIAEDFLGFVSPPVIELLSTETHSEHISSEYDIEDGRVVLLSNEINGLFKIMYKRKPKEINLKGTAAGDNSIIDLDEELCSLLPILIASYVWVEDEPEKAQYYLALYNERAVDIERRKVNSNPVKMINITGW